MNTLCPPKHVPLATRFFTHCRLTMQPPRATALEVNAALGSLQASLQAPDQTTGVAEIDTIKLYREKQKALAKRKATPVVGDMQALADALPDLAELLAASKIRSLKKLKTIVKKQPEPKEFSKMKHTQKRKFIDAEMSRFAEAISNSEFKSNPLAAIGEHLRKRLKEEEEESPS
ncbi:UNVERIFIED_CONTAM: hypothetical protein FKN15_039048 [Acipenser sinensis]